MRIGYLIKTGNGITISRVGSYVKGFLGEPEGTINQAEYLAVIHALRHAVRLGFTSAQCSVDSQLLSKQVSGAYRVKDKKLSRLARELNDLRPCFSSVVIVWNPREKNTEADRLTHMSVFQETAALTGPTRGSGRRPRKLPVWLAARIRRWMAGNSGVNQHAIGRAVGLDMTGMRQLLREQTYAGASEVNLPDWDAYKGPPVLPLNSIDDGTGWPDRDDLSEILDDDEPVLLAP